MATSINRADYAAMFGPTVGDKIRLADTDLIIEVERDLTKDRPGEVVLLVRQNAELGTRIGGINEHRGSEVFLYVVNAQAAIDLGSGRDITFGRNHVGTDDPLRACLVISSESDLLTY